MRTLRALDAFAAGLRARHRRRAGRVPALHSVTLVVPRALAPVWHLHPGAPRLHVAPSIALTIAGPAPVPPVVRGAPATLAPAPGLAALRREITTRRVHEARIVVQRIYSRGVRIEAGAPRPASSSAAPSSTAPPAPAAVAPAPAPVALVLAPRPPVAVAPDARGEATAGDRPGAAAPDAARPAPPPPAVPALDVEQITDSVIGALDRRLIAHRERFGVR